MVGKRIRQLREGRGIGLRALARSAGLALSHLLAVEKGRANPSIDYLQRIADALSIPVTALLADAPDSTAPAAPEDENAPKARAPRRGSKPQEEVI